MVGAGRESQEEDKKVLRAIKGIIRRGNDAEGNSIITRLGIF